MSSVIWLIKACGGRVMAISILHSKSVRNFLVISYAFIENVHWGVSKWKIHGFLEKRIKDFGNDTEIIKARMHLGRYY